MLDLKQPLTLTFTCPDCGCKFGQQKALLFQGMHVLALCLCECCEKEYYHTIPSGHSALFPVAFAVNNDASRYDAKVKDWMALPLIRSVKNETNTVSLKVEKKGETTSRSVILLNCLDSCYGHILLKLLNAQSILKDLSGNDLILLIPASFQWLAPDKVGEAWLVEGRLRDFDKRILNLDDWIKNELKRFDKVVLHEAPVHPDISRIDMSGFLREEKFDLNTFEDQPAHITFITREDRFWLNSVADLWLQKLCVRTGMIRPLKWYFVLRQNRLFGKLARRIDKMYGKKITFAAAGIGVSGSLDDIIEDHRKLLPDEATERSWCRLYSRSHLVIGIHGSNMLIPTALSAGFIEILPGHKIDHLTEDIAQDHKGRYMHFLGRYLDEHTSVALVAKHTVSMLEWFPFLKKNTEAGSE